ncbi:hypothetical protein M405DRAFT_828520 [Rhizopogon salebrosus TDB-379]|nr:hypothetical protein M405DRAFT_828520 [Rhizopogon salebrosus TDB-379]
MYWAIVNDRREALSALVGYISQISSVCFDDLRIACMLASDHTLFTQLGLELDIGHSLGRSPFVDHEVEVHEGYGMYEDQFVALFRFKKCQRSLRIAETMSAEFVARGRIWCCAFPVRGVLGNGACHLVFLSLAFQRVQKL